MMSAVLPLEIWGEILSWLDLEDLEACDIVCKEWHVAELLCKSIRRLSFEDSYFMKDEKLAKMINLEFLELSTTIKGFCLDNFSKFDKLRQLRIGISGIVGCDMRGLTNLDSLCASRYCRIEEDLQLPVSLRSIDIGFCTNPNLFSGLTNLTILKFAQAHKVNKECLYRVPQLRSLSLDADVYHPIEFLSEDEDIFRSLSSLTELSVCGESNITNKSLAPLVHLTRLRLGENMFVTSQGLNALPCLNTVALASFDPMIDRSKLKSSIKLYTINEDLESLGNWHCS